jgi:8-oxo-dGTP diphosphatase
VAQRTATFQTPDGEMVIADERFFLIRVDQLEISVARWTDLERQVMADHVGGRSPIFDRPASKSGP